MIAVEGITRRYGDFVAVEDVSFAIQRGEIVGLLGHNGAGKTTIMKMMTGFLEPSAGRIRVDEADVAKNRRLAQAKIGYLPENCPAYPDMTVADFLDYSAALHGVPVGQRARMLRQAIDDTDLGEKADQPISTLSRGYRQRVGVAQAILHRPQFFILDEPTNGLDPSQITQMRVLVRRLAENATVILSTHILQEVQAVCDRVIIIRSGRIALDSPLADVRLSNRLVVAVGGSLEAARSAFSAAACIVAVAHLGSEGDRHRFALRIAGSVDDAGAAIAATVTGGGLRLFALHPEQRDLEAVFARINDGREVADV
jgi:ABC-2 type transport system ATP-binding protein